MAGKINLAIVLGIVCLGATYGQDMPEMPLKFDCYGHNNFTYVPWQDAVYMHDICGPDFWIDHTFGPAAQLMNIEVKMNCLRELPGDLGGQPLSLAPGDMVNDKLGEVPIYLGSRITETDYCNFAVQILVFENNVDVIYVSDYTGLLLTVPTDAAATLRVEDLMGMTFPSPISVTSLEHMQGEILGQVMGVYVKHMKLPNVPLMIATFLRYRSTYVYEATGSDCNGFGLDEDKYPYLNSSDIVLNVTTFTGDPNSLMEQQSINLLDTTWTIPDNICGDFDLVFMVDPVFTVFPPINNRCNYFKAYKINIACSGTMPHIQVPFQCEMTQNAFSPGDVFFSTKSVKWDDMMLKNEAYFHYFEREPHGEKTSWKESTKWGDPSHQLKVQGYAWMNLVYKMFEQQHPNLVTDCSMTSFDVQATIKTLDGIDSIVDVQEPGFINYYNEWEDQPYDIIQNQLSNEEGIGVFTVFESRISQNIKLGVLQGLKMAKMPTMSVPTGTFMFDAMHDGETKTIEEQVKSILKQDFADEGDLLTLVRNASAKMAQLNSKFGIDATCFARSFNAIMNLTRESYGGYLQLMPNVDLTVRYMDLFDDDGVNEFLYLHGTMLKKNLTRISMNGCIRRIDRMMQADCDDKIAIADLDMDAKTRICIMSRFREYLETNIRSLGIPYVVKEVMRDRVKEARRGEPGVKFGYPLRVTNGLYNLWVDEWENENQFFHEYEVLPTYTHVCRRKMASCRCETCDHDGSDYMSDDYSSSSPYDYSSSSPYDYSSSSPYDYSSSSPNDYSGYSSDDYSSSSPYSRR